MRCHVPLVNHGDNVTNVSEIEDEADRLSHGFGAQAGALRLRGNSETDLGLLPVGRDANAHIAKQFAGVSIRDPELDPGSGRKEAHVAHVLDKSRRLVVRLRLPPLKLAHNRVVPVRLKSAEIAELEPPQHDAAGTSGKRIGGHDHVSHGLKRTTAAIIRMSTRSRTVKRSHRICHAGLLMAVLLAGAAPERLAAWGAQGHRLVAQIAAQHLTDTAAHNVTWLLAPQSLADVSSWADRIVDANRQTFFWHFVNIPIDASRYDRDRDCPRQPDVQAGSRADEFRDCVVDRIRYHSKRLADTSLDRADRAIALKFLVHFVGDLHQPYHALGVGRGGNDIRVSVFGETRCGSDPCNLHSVWDSLLIAHRNLSDEDYLARLNDLLARQRVAGITDAETWAAESHSLAKAALLEPSGRVDEAYFQAQIPVIEQRVAIGGLRLAALLNETLTAPPPPGP